MISTKVQADNPAHKATSQVLEIMHQNTVKESH